MAPLPPFLSAESAESPHSGGDTDTEQPCVLCSTLAPCMSALASGYAGYFPSSQCHLVVTVGVLL